MTAANEPNPSTRKSEDFPKTTTMPEGWIGDALMETYNHSGPVPPTGGSNGKVHLDTRPTPQVEDESLFTRRLDPFPKTNTMPTGWDLSAL